VSGLRIHLGDDQQPVRVGVNHIPDVNQRIIHESSSQSLSIEETTHPRNLSSTLNAARADDGRSREHMVKKRKLGNNLDVSAPGWAVWD
jgi:hypothetical protein